MNIRTTSEHVPHRTARFTDKIGNVIKQLYRRRRTGIATGVGTLAILGGLGAVGSAVVKSATETANRITAMAIEASQPTHVQQERAALRQQVLVPVANQKQTSGLGDLDTSSLAGIGTFLLGAGGMTAVWALRETSRADATPRSVNPAAAMAEPLPVAEMPHLTDLFSDQYKLTPGQQVTAWAIGGLAGAGSYTHITANKIATTVQHGVETWRDNLEAQVAATAEQPYNAFATYHCPGVEIPAFDSVS